MPFKFDQQVLDCLAGTSRCLSAYDIARALSEFHPVPIRAASIYRCLERLIAKNLVRKVVSQSAFVAVPANVQSDDLELLVVTCSSCRRSEVHATAYARTVLAAARSRGFCPTELHLEAIGTCPACASELLGPRECASQTPSKSKTYHGHEEVRPDRPSVCLRGLVSQHRASEKGTKPAPAPHDRASAIP